MWPINGFANNGDFSNNFNQQDDYPPSPFAAGPINQQYFPQLPFQPNPMQIEGGNGRENFMNDNYQPEVGFYNDSAFSQNHFATPPIPEVSQFSPLQLNPSTAPTPTPRPITHISSRAAELKAELMKSMKSRERVATPPVGMVAQISKQNIGAEGSNSLCGSPKTPITSDQEATINELISHYADGKQAEDTEMKVAGVSTPLTTKTDQATSQQSKPQPKASVKSQGPSLGSPEKVTKPSNRKLDSNGIHTNGTESGHASSGSMSEGEIMEDRAAPRKASTPREPKDSKATSRTYSKDASTVRRELDEQPLRSSQGRLRETSPRRAPLSSQAPQATRRVAHRCIEDDRDDTDSRHDSSRTYRLDYRNERKPRPAEPDISSQQRRDTRDQAENHNNIDVKNEKQDASRASREDRNPILADLLPHDEDLKEWLEITGYHNQPYRAKILNRRRAIAALDAQRNALLAEMEAEERGGVQALAGLAIPSSIMLPPPVPNKAGDRAEPPTKPPPTGPEVQYNRVVSNKRFQSDSQDPRDESSAKIARTNDRGSRIKQEYDGDFRPQSSGYDPSRRRSFDERRGERESTFNEIRGRGRGNSRERDTSPGILAFESRPLARNRSFDNRDEYWRRDRDDHDERERDHRPSDSRPFVVRGTYKGRAFDPNYRGRGGRGGSGRGDHQGHNEMKVESQGFGSRFANGKPFKDIRSFERGGNGDTRYFIVKSFNEENVVRCLKDGIWTTQIQNGPLFKEAFEKCKNVILVFSINKSRAFQGYARMESLPGSVEKPYWQRSINWESAGAFHVRWLVVCLTRFHRIGHLRNSLNENLAVLVGKDGQEIEETCARHLIELIDEEVNEALDANWRYPNGNASWDD